MLPDFGDLFVQKIGTEPIYLCVPGACPLIVTTDNKLFAISFVVEWEGQQFMGTLEYLGRKADANCIALDLVDRNVYCQPRPDLAYIAPEIQQRVVPFRLVEKPRVLTHKDSSRIKAAESKRARRAARCATGV